MEIFEKNYYRRYQFNEIGGLHRLPYNNAKINLRDKKYLQNILEKSLIKRNNRLTILQNRLKKDIEKNQYNKHYQVNNMTEFNMLKKYVNENLNSKYPILWCNYLNNSSQLYKNKLKYIIGSEQYEYPSDDEKIEFVQEKTPIIYAYFDKTKYNERTKALTLTQMISLYKICNEIKKMNKV